MTRIIACVSGKGGAGKTTITANLGVALAELGKRVIVVDTNVTTPNLGMHLGIPFYPTTLHDVLKGKNSIREAMYEHESGVRIVPAGISLKDLQGADPKHLQNTLLELLGDADIILLDVAAGLGREALSAMEAADELILITNPEVTAVTDALKAAKLAQQLGARVSGVVINRVRNKKYEMKKEDIVSLLGGYELLGTIPEHEKVPEAISRRMPVIHHAERCPASVSLRRVAARIAGTNYYYGEPFYQRLFRAFR